MAIFTGLAAWATAALGTGWSFLGLSPALTQAIFAVGRAVSWSLASAALARSSVPRQEVQANIQQTDGPRIRAYGRVLLGGQRALWETDDGKLYQIILCHHGRVDALVKYWIDGEPVTVDGSGLVTSAPFDGDDLQLLSRNGGALGGDYAQITTALPAIWTADHKLTGQATIATILDHPGPERFGKVFPKGPMTQIQGEFRASRVKPGTGTPIYSENAAWCIRDYLTHQDGFRLPETLIDEDRFAAFAARCDEAVPLKAGGTEPRYRLCGHYSLADAPKDTLGRMLATCDGQIFQTPEGKVAGKVRAPRRSVVGHTNRDQQMIAAPIGDAARVAACAGELQLDRAATAMRHMAFQTQQPVGQTFQPAPRLICVDGEIDRKAGGDHGASVMGRTGRGQPRAQPSGAADDLRGIDGGRNMDRTPRRHLGKSQLGGVQPVRRHPVGLGQHDGMRSFDLTLKQDLDRLGATSFPNDGVNQRDDPHILAPQRQSRIDRHRKGALPDTR